MNLYIETKNGQTKNHPAFEDNLLQAFGAIPDHWETFVRVERPNALVYQVLDSDEPTYQKINGVWTDVWSLRDMIVEEKAAKQQAVRDAFNSRDQASNWSAWTLDEATCEMVPPVARPELDQTKLDAGIRTLWCGADNNWKDTPAYPKDEKQYKFDFIAWNWVEVQVNSNPA
jgi:hypothetical protein